MDGCKNYSVFSEANRTQGNTSSPLAYMKCSENLVTGWYRFEEAAGDQMQDKLVLMGRCRGRTSWHLGWLNGTQPTVAEGVVTRKVCFSGPKNCCAWRNIIKVKNCSGYYVYELQWMPNCSYRLCGNADACKLHSF